MNNKKSENKTKKNNIRNKIKNKKKKSKTKKLITGGIEFDGELEYGYGSYLDKYLIRALVHLDIHYRYNIKKVLLIGQSYFILLPLIFNNAEYTFIDYNRDLLQAMQDVIEYAKTLDNMKTFISDVFTKIDELKLCRSEDLNDKLNYILETYNIKSTDEIIIQASKIIKKSVLEEQFVFIHYDVNLVDEPDNDITKKLSTTKFDLFNLTNLHLSIFGVQDKLYKLCALLYNEGCKLFHFSDSSCNASFIYYELPNHDSMFTTISQENFALKDFYKTFSNYSKEIDNYLLIVIYEYNQSLLVYDKKENDELKINFTKSIMNKIMIVNPDI